MWDRISVVQEPVENEADYDIGVSGNFYKGKIILDLMTSNYTEKTTQNKLIG
jgi:hypothetical protein